MNAVTQHIAIELRHITVKYPGQPLIEDACATYRTGELVTLIGRNGSGKSTLLRTIAALLRPASGSINIGSEDIHKISREKLARSVSVVTTTRNRISHMRCRDIVAMGRSPYTGWSGRLSSADNAIVEECLAKAGVCDYAMRDIDTISDGELQRVMIARALAQDTPVMLLDEPTSFLDLPSRHQVIKLLAQLAHDDGKCIIFSTHEVDIALRYCDTVSLIETPSLVTGPVDEVISSGAISRAFNL